MLPEDKYLLRLVIKILHNRPWCYFSVFKIEFEEALAYRVYVPLCKAPKFHLLSEIRRNFDILRIAHA